MAEKVKNDDKDLTFVERIGIWMLGFGIAFLTAGKHSRAEVQVLIDAVFDKIEE